MINPELTLDEVKKSLAITHTISDEYILSLIPVAIQFVEDDIDRPLDDEICLTATGETKTPLRQAILMTIGTLYDHRTSQQVEQMYDNPAYDRLVHKYRKMGV
ncbi:head-tail connector protein [Moraxella canis]|uniref:DNA packaging protein n=1 Tax=Moraxella canis TaxID=90239 RepID=A0A1S9ZKD7_9GAMM|nr:head-tail connector protein [Moraxella canis]OOR83908.1 hypothetical protein B0180_05560 [Moraxella canis]